MTLIRMGWREGLLTSTIGCALFFRRRLEGGDGPPSPWPIAILKVIRADDEEITRLTPETLGKIAVEPSS